MNHKQSLSRPRGVNRRMALSLGGAAALLATGVQAQDTWPNRPLRMIVPSAGGGGTDILCRVFTDWLGQALKQPVIVDNKPGANGVIAAEALIKAPADGYTLAWMSSSSTVIAQALQPRQGYDVTTDMSAIVQIGAGGIHLVVAPDFPAQNLREFIAVLKANPGKYNYGSWGTGSTGHLMMEWLKTQTGTDVRHVPYKTIPQIYQDLQGGNIHIGWVDSISSVPLIKAGKLRGLATSASRRGPAIPELPTLSEQGYRFESDAWYGVFAPRGTPQGPITTVNRLIKEAMLAPSLQGRLLSLNLGETPPRSPEEFSRLVKTDLGVWRDIVRANGIKIE